MPSDNVVPKFKMRTGSSSKISFVNMICGHPLRGVDIKSDKPKPGSIQGPLNVAETITLLSRIPFTAPTAVHGLQKRVTLPQVEKITLRLLSVLLFKLLARYRHEGSESSGTESKWRANSLHQQEYQFFLTSILALMRLGPWVSMSIMLNSLDM